MAWHRVWSPTFVVLQVLTVIHPVVSFSLFHRRRHVFPISGHAHWLIGISQVFMVTQSLIQNHAAILSNEVPCALLLFAHQLVLFAISCIIARAWRVWFHYLYARERVQAQASSDNGGGKRWFADHAHWFREKRLIVFAFVWGGVEFLITLGAWLREPSTTEQSVDANGVETQCPSLDVPNFAGNAVSGVNLIVIVYVAYCLRNTHEAFGIIREMKLSSLVGVVVVVSVYGRGRWLPLQVYRLIWCLATHVFVFNSTTMKILSSYNFEQPSCDSATRPLTSDEAVALSSLQTKRRASEDVAVERTGKPEFLSAKATLAYVLKDPHWCAQFTEHLAREFSVENFLFCKAVDEFVDKCENDGFASATQKNERATEIYMEFVCQHAPQEVNLSAGNRVPIDAEITRIWTNFDVPSSRRSPPGSLVEAEAVQDSVFSEARKEIFKLMENDTFIRFRNNNLSPKPQRRTDQSVSWVPLHLRSGEYMFASSRARSGPLQPSMVDLDDSSLSSMELRTPSNSSALSAV